jgi:hypothetical protein
MNPENRNPYKPKKRLGFWVTGMQTQPEPQTQLQAQPGKLIGKIPKRIRETMESKYYIPELALAMGVPIKKVKIVYSIEDVKQISNDTYSIVVKVIEVTRGGE